MGCDTKGVVVTACKDTMLVLSLVTAALDKYIRAARANDTKMEGLSTIAVRGHYQHCTVDLSPRSGFAGIDFRVAGVQRRMYVFFDCDGDHADLGPLSIGLSMGAFGDSEAYVLTALRALSVLGDCYFDANDCDNIDKAPLANFGIQPCTLQDLIAEGLYGKNSRELANFQDNWQRGLLRGGAASLEVFGGQALAPAC